MIEIIELDKEKYIGDKFTVQYQTQGYYDIKSSESGFDGIIDFESVLADPANPTNLLYEYTKADGLHPYEGYSAMADSVDLNMFMK